MTHPNAPRLLNGDDPRILLVCDHASNAVPPGLDPGVPPEAMRDHVAWDIGAEALQTADQKVAIPPMVGALLKNEQDLTLFEKLVFMQSRNR